jgi:hypothetical protein
MRPRLCGSSWVLRPACFHAVSEDWIIDRPQIVRIRFGSLFHQANSSPEFLRFSHCPALSCAAATYLGFCPLLDIITFLPIRRRSKVCWRRPGALNRSTTSAMRLASLFHPAAKFRTPSRSGVYPLRVAFSLHQTEFCTHAVELPHTHLQAGCRVRAPRLRCFTPHETAFRSVWQLASPAVAPLFEFVCSPRFNLSRRKQLPVHERSCRFLRILPASSEEKAFWLQRRDFSAFPTKALDVLANQNARPARAFWAFLVSTFQRAVTRRPTTRGVPLFGSWRTRNREASSRQPFTRSDSASNLQPLGASGSPPIPIEHRAG